MGSSRHYSDKEPDKLPDLQPDEDKEPSKATDPVGETSVFYARPMEGADEKDPGIDPGLLDLFGDQCDEFDPETFNSDDLFDGTIQSYNDMVVSVDQINHWDADYSDTSDEAMADRVTLTFEPGEETISNNSEGPPAILRERPTTPINSRDDESEDLAGELEYLLSQFEANNRTRARSNTDSPPEADNDDIGTETDELKAFLKSEFLSDPGEWPLHEPDDPEAEEEGEPKKKGRIKQRAHQRAGPGDKVHKYESKAKRGQRKRPEPQAPESQPLDQPMFPAERTELNTQIPMAGASGSAPHGRSRFSLLKASLITLLLLGAIVWLGAHDTYQVESDLLLVPDKMSQTADSQWTLNKEAMALKSSGLVYAFSEWVFSEKSGETPDSPLIGMTRESFGSEGKLMKWLSRNLSVTPDIEKGFVSLSIEGHDPRLLKEVLDKYVTFYAGYRPGVIQEAQTPRREMKPDYGKVRSAELETIGKSLSHLNSQIQEAELALKIMRSGNGPFRGFLSSDNAAKIPSIASFQSKIVELELRKKELEVKYKKGARELESIDAQITGVRKAMMECVEERLRFLKTKAHQLMASKERLEAQLASRKPKKSHRANRTPFKSRNTLEIPTSTSKAPKLGEGLYLIERAHIVRVPIKETIRRLADKLSGKATYSAGQLSDGLRKTLKTYPFACEAPDLEEGWDNPAAGDTGKIHSGNIKTDADDSDSHTSFKSRW